MTSVASLSTPAEATTIELDAVVLGAGVAGLYQLYQLREQGLRVRAYDAAGGVGGTWYWNRYPGARLDSESFAYQYLFSEDLYKGWSWSQRFADQPEIERWLQWVADQLDLHRDIQLETKIESAHYDEDRGRWIVRTDRGDVIDTQFFISCAGPVSAPLNNIFEGQESFRGSLVHTARWPEAGVELAGKRVGVVGVAASGIQVIQTIAPEVEHLTVFARGAQYVLPMKNPQFGPDEQTAYKARFDELRSTLPHTFTGFQFDLTTWADVSAEQRREFLEATYEDGSLKLWLAGPAEVFSDPGISEEVSEFVREKMRDRLKHDSHLCDVLVPTHFGFGTHRVPLETNYLETYLNDNVELVGVKNNAIARILPEGIELTDGTVYELDVLILATGFDAGTGSLARMDVRGRDGRSLADEWQQEIRTMMGLAKHGYPNFLASSIPLSPGSALCNSPVCLQQQTEWITRTILYMREQGKFVIEPTKEAEDAWVAHHDETAAATLLASATASWWSGGNVPGKPQQRILPYTGGVGVYRQKCDEVAESGYPGFEFT